MFLWYEGIASRGSYEVGSCLLKYLRDTQQTATHLVTFSDCCGGKNRNVNILALWLHIVSSEEYPVTTIDQKFMTVGHLYLPNDRDFASIETAKRKSTHIYIPQDWSSLIRGARRVNPFSVTEMGQADFISLEPLAKWFINRKTNSQGQKVDWLEIKWIRVTERPLEFQYKYSLRHGRQLTSNADQRIDHRILGQSC